MDLTRRRKALDFPILTTTRLGTTIKLTGYNKDSDRPWIGEYTVNLLDSKHTITTTWREDGAFIDKETPRSFDITVPEWIRTESSQSSS